MSTAPIAGCTVGQLLRQAAVRHGEAAAVAAPERGITWSFAALDRRADAIARACRAHGLKPGDRAVVWCINIPDWIELQYGLARAGVILVTANTALKAAEIGYILTQSGAAALFFGRGTADHDFPGTLAALAAPLPRLLVGMDGARRAGSIDLAAFRAAGAADTAVVEPAERDAIINMQYTSGTTGHPKGVMLSHANIVDNAATMARTLGLRADDRLCLCVPLFHCFGCVIGTLGAHSAGACVVLNDAFRAEAILDTIARERCTVLYGVPTMFTAELEKQRQRPRDLGSLRVGVMAGAVCPAPLMRAVIDEFPLPGLVIAYGLTEASPGITLSQPADPLEERVTTVGRPLPGVTVRIVDPASGRDLPHGATGELWSRGANTMRGYFGDPAATAAAITPDGWLRTGDLARLTDTGAVQIVGRIKELIIRGGENISPAEIEDVLRSHPAIADVAVFGIPCAFFGEQPAAAVRLRDAHTVTDTELQAFVRERLADHKVPARILFVAALPLTGSGKVKRFQLRELALADGHPGDAAPTDPTSGFR